MSALDPLVLDPLPLVLALVERSPTGLPLPWSWSSSWSWSSWQRRARARSAAAPSWPWSSSSSSPLVLVIGHCPWSLSPALVAQLGDDVVAVLWLCLLVESWRGQPLARFAPSLSCPLPLVGGLSPAPSTGGYDLLQRRRGPPRDRRSRCARVLKSLGIKNLDVTIPPGSPRIPQDPGVQGLKRARSRGQIGASEAPDGATVGPQ